ncbi:MAG: SufD family Fe-S cluster assembly protein [Alphaproteobacteria bacterium]
MISASDQLLAAFPPKLHTRAEREAWVYLPPHRYTENCLVGHTATLSYHTPIHHTLQAGTLHAGAHTLRVDGTQVLVEVVQGDVPHAALADTQQFEIAANASLLHVRLHTGAGSRTRRQVVANVAAGGAYRQFTLTANGGMNRTETRIVLAGENAETHVTGLNLLRGDEVADSFTHVAFDAEHCRANVRQRNLVDGKARAIFQGKFHVHAHAQKTAAYMLCQNVLLSDTAQVQMKPELEIYADDVTCSHGATTGGLDAAQLFYLQARGIPANVARQLLVAGQVEELLAELPEEIQPTLRPVVFAWLEQVGERHE